MFGQVPDRKRVFVKAARKPLIRHVDECQQFAFDDDIRNRAPVIVGRVQARRIVATTMEQHRLAFGN